MTYATEADFVTAYGQELTVELTNLQNPEAETIDGTVLDRALSKASAIIDGYVGARYSLPLPAIPPTLTALSLDIARYQMGHYGIESDPRKRYEDALKMLRDIANGTLSLGLPEGEAPVSGLPQIAGGGRPISGALRGWGWP